jgi:hypothetical protein
VNAELLAKAFAERLTQTAEAGVGRVPVDVGVSERPLRGLERGRRRRESGHSLSKTNHMMAGVPQRGRSLIEDIERRNNESTGARGDNRHQPPMIIVPRLLTSAGNAGFPETTGRLTSVPRAG